MKDAQGATKQLLGEIATLRQRVAGLETSELERKRAEAALRDSKERYRILYEDNPSMYFTLDIDGTVLSVNQFGAEQLGYTADGLIGQSVLHVFHQDDREAVLQHLAGCVQNPGVVSHWEFRKVRKNGSLMWVREAARAIRSTDGKTVVLIVCEDITERKLAEEALQRAHDELEHRVEERTTELSDAIEFLRQSEERYRAVIEDQTEMVCRWLPDATLTFVNQAYSRYFGKTAEELVGSSYLSLVPEVDRESVEAHVAKVIASVSEANPISSLEHPVVLASGEIRWQQWIDRAIFDKQGQLVEFQSVGRDITERKQAEEALRESEERFRAMADTAPVMIWMSGTDKLCTYLNKPWLDFTGRTLEQEMGNGWSESVHPGDLQRCLDTYLTAFNARRAFTMEYRLRRHDGEYRWIIDTAIPRLTPEGTFAGYIGSCIDITERKRAEEALSESEAAIRESRKALQDLAGQLLASQEAERRRLAREMHDDLTQRLAVLAIEAGKLEAELEADGSEAAEKLRHMKEQAVKLAADVHAISRQLHPSILDDLGLADAIEAECASVSQREGILVTYEPENVPEAVPKELGLCLYRITQEALRNIAKHARTQEGHVSLFGRDGGIILRIQDNGIGFAPGKVRGKRGLGLASMEERARLVQAELSVRSQPGKGTVIEVRAPLRGREE